MLFWSRDEHNERPHSGHLTTGNDVNLDLLLFLMEVNLHLSPVKRVFIFIFLNYITLLTWSVLIMVSCAKTWFMSVVLFSFRDCAVILLRHAHVITPLTKYFAWRHTVLLHQRWQNCWYTASFFLIGFPWMYISTPCYIVLRLQWNECTRMLNNIIMWEHFCVHTSLGAVIVWLTIWVLSIVHELHFSHHTKVWSQCPF